MVDNVFELKPTLYNAKIFRVQGWTISGTLCGHIDVATPDAGIYVMSPGELQDLIVGLTQSRLDVLAHSNPMSDPRLYDVGPSGSQ